MSKDSRIEGRLTIGMDLGDKYSQVCVLDESGMVLERARLVTSSTAFGRRFGSCEPARVAIEVGTHSPWVRRLLEDCGHEVLVANARKLRRRHASSATTPATDKPTRAPLYLQAKAAPTARPEDSSHPFPCPTVYPQRHTNATAPNRSVPTSPVAKCVTAIDSGERANSSMAHRAFPPRPNMRVAIHHSRGRQNSP